MAFASIRRSGKAIRVLELPQGYLPISAYKPNTEEPPEIIRTLIYVEVNNRLVLRCPEYTYLSSIFAERRRRGFPSANYYWDVV